jgi:hypothetical protein
MDMEKRIGVNVFAVLAVIGTVITTADQGTAAPEQESELACITMNTERLPLDTRRSPLDSISFQVAGSPAKICYGRPSANGREIFGGLEEYGELWRTGANEPTMIHTSIPLSIAGIRVEPGTYSLYTIPGESEWEVIVNASITQWGHERFYKDGVEAKEVGRATVAAGETAGHVETFTISAEAAAGENVLVVLEWERTRVEVPVSGAE